MIKSRIGLLLVSVIFSIGVVEGFKGEDTNYQELEVGSNTIESNQIENVKSKDWENELTDLLTSIKGKGFYLGGDSPEEGFDTSGLAYWAYKQMGIDLERTTSKQYNQVKHIELNQLKSGDLVFFKNTTYTNGKDIPSEVGIYIDNGEFWHVTPKHGVIKSNLNDYDSNNILGFGQIEIPY